MLPLLDKPVIDYIVNEALQSGLDEILMIVGYGKDAIVNYFDRSDLDEKFFNDGDKDFPDIFFIRQRKPLGLGDAIKYAKKFVEDDPFVILLGDTVYRSNTSYTVTSQIIEKFLTNGAPTIAVEKVPKEKVRDYGIINGTEVSEGTYIIKSLVEKPDPESAPSDLGVTGIYVMEPDIFDYLDRIEIGKNGEYQFTDALNLYSIDKKIYATTFSGRRFDIGTMETWIKIFFEFARNDMRYAHLLR